jgi:hypothetical protein
MQLFDALEHLDDVIRLLSFCSRTHTLLSSVNNLSILWRSQSCVSANFRATDSGSLSLSLSLSICVLRAPTRLKVVHEVFGRIEDKVASNRDKLISVNNRINAAKAKVDGIVGSKKATQVFSSAKYPGPAALIPFAPVYQGVERQEVPHEFHPEVDSRIGKGTPEEMENKLQFFSIDFQAKYETTCPPTQC